MRGRESGQLMVLVALGMVAFLGFAALAVDLGNGYGQRRQAQNAADAAALAGMRMVRLNDGSITGPAVHSEIVRVATANQSGVQVVSDEVIGLDAQSKGPVSAYSGAWDEVAGIQVVTNVTYKTYFARVVGKPTLSSAGKGTAMSLAVRTESVKGLAPIAAPRKPYYSTDPDDEYTVGTEYRIWDSDFDDTGNLGWLDFSGGSNGASDLEDWIDHGYPYPAGSTFELYDDGSDSSSSGEYSGLAADKWIEGSPGVNDSVLQEAKTAYPPGTHITIVIYTDNNDLGGGNYKYQIYKLAEFEITDISDSGGNKWIKGKFVDWVAPGEAIPGTYSTEQFTTVKLVPNVIPTSLPSPTSWPTSTATATPVGPTLTSTATATPTTTPTPTVTPTPTATPVPQSQSFAPFTVPANSTLAIPLSPTFTASANGTLTSTLIDFAVSSGTTTLYFRLASAGTTPSPAEMRTSPPSIKVRENDTAVLSQSVSAGETWQLFVFNDGNRDASVLGFTVSWP